VLLASVYPDFGTRGPRVLTAPARATAFLGVYSYTIYLFHSVVYVLPGVRLLRASLMSHFDEAPLLVTWLDRLLFWSLSIGGGVLLAKLVEKPFLRLRERWCPGARTVAAKVPALVAVTSRKGRESPVPC
jgi:peptidoglycan/LPS O-acetylase OafA/YrhL